MEVTVIMKKEKKKRQPFSPVRLLSSQNEARMHKIQSGMERSEFESWRNVGFQVTKSLHTSPILAREKQHSGVSDNNFDILK